MNWKRALKKEINREFEGDIRLLQEQRRRILRAYELKLKILQILERPVEAIFGSTKVYIRTFDFRVAHELSRKLGIIFWKDTDSYGATYTGQYNGIEIEIYGIKQLPGCKLVPKTRTVTETYYEIVCGGESDAD
ncbi:MAG: hypothetical protein DRJ38_00425 [Thermoprotei archaeon]|nr:MAG: hypothetical protein DRJ38_00425 [Thermoprotei archaeon]